MGSTQLLSNYTRLMSDSVLAQSLHQIPTSTNIFIARPKSYLPKHNNDLANMTMNSGIITAQSGQEYVSGSRYRNSKRSKCVNDPKRFRNMQLNNASVDSPYIKHMIGISEMHRSNPMEVINQAEDETYRDTTQRLPEKDILNLNVPISAMDSRKRSASNQKKQTQYISITNVEFPLPQKKTKKQEMSISQFQSQSPNTRNRISSLLISHTSQSPKFQALKSNK